MNRRWNVLKISLGLFLFAPITLAAPSEYFAIHVVDDQTGRGVPLVELQLTSELRLYTDSNGYVAFNEPGLMDTDVYFDVGSWGYEGPKYAFGNQGVTLKTTPGKEATVKVHRTNIAERMYRLTGSGIYRDTVLLGKNAPLEHPVINGGVMGQDTVETAIYHGKMYWFWGDTDNAFFPLGLFATGGGTSALPSQLNLDKGIDYTYFTNPKNGFCRGMITVKAKGSNPIWIDGLMVVPEGTGEKMFCHFVRTKDLAVVEQGFATWDDTKQIFEETNTYELHSGKGAGGHPMLASDGGQKYFYFPKPYITSRVKADAGSVIDINAYESFTCLKPGAKFTKENPSLNRDGSGKLLWTWQQGADALGPKQVAALIDAGAIKREESPYQLRDVETGKNISLANGSVVWNPYLKKWTMLLGQLGGASNLGEIYFAVANSPEGPWRDAHKVATHARKGNNNDFYNPMQHPELMQENGKIVYFEGTFVTTFSGNPAPTPRYNYNQILYRIDLSDPRMKFDEPPVGLSDAKPQ